MRLFAHRDVFRACRGGRGALLLAACVALAATGTRLRADIQVPTASKGKGAREQRRELPANGVPTRETIDLGGTVEVTLQARGQLGKIIDFAIRTPPAHGSLTGPPRQLTRDTAAVTYVHRAADGPGADAFTYSVQAAGSALSAPVAVEIAIKDTPPAIVGTPVELDFGAVKVGDTSGADLTLENRGGGEAVGRLDLPHPWTVDGTADYRLTRGQRQTFHLLFAPRSGSSFSETVPLPGDAAATAHLLGTGLGPAGGGPLLSISGVPTSLPVAAQARVDIAGAEALLAAVAQATPVPVPAASVAPVPAATPVAKGGLTVDPMRNFQAPDETAASVAPASTPLDSAGYFTLKDTGVKKISLIGAGRSTLDISWLPAYPPPQSYRVELRYLSIEAGTILHIDWRPYAQVEIKVDKGLCTAHLRGLPPQTRQTLRVVAVDAGGRLTAASATLQATTLLPSTFWHITPLKVLTALLLLCLYLAVRKRLETRQILRQIDEERAESPIVLYRS